MADTAIKSHPYILSMLVQASRVVGKIKIRDKESSWVWKLMPRWWRNCITVIGKTIWFPGGEYIRPDDTMCLVVTHEVVHQVQKKELGRLRFYSRYLAPQAFILLAGVLLTVPLIGAAALLFPWPSPWRTALEEEAYATESWLAWKLNRDSKAWKGRLQDALSSNIYWGMASDTRAWRFSNQTIIDIWVKGDLTSANATVIKFAQRAFGEWQKQKAESKGETK